VFVETQADTGSLRQAQGGLFDCAHDRFAAAGFAQDDRRTTWGNEYNSDSMLPAVSSVTGDILRFLFLVVIGGGLLALGRWSSRLGAPPIPDSPANAPTPDADELQPDDKRAPRVWPPSAEEIAASFPFDPLLGKIQIKKFFFKKVDAIPGPADPEIFADELHAQLYDPDTDHGWWQSYFVATPEGLAGILRDKSWKYLYAPEMLVVPRYDLEEIRRAVVSRIMADHEFFKDKKELEEESL
jgi:hypothetical protein